MRVSCTVLCVLAASEDLARSSSCLEILSVTFVQCILQADKHFSIVHQNGSLLNGLFTNITVACENASYSLA